MNYSSRILAKLAVVPLILLVVILIRLLRPLVVIRFGALYSSRIGHFAACTEQYLCERDAGINTPTRSFVDICYYRWPYVCNTQLQIMWERVLRVYPRWISLVDRANRRLPGSEIHVIEVSRSDRDVHNLLERYPPHLSFLPEEESQGQNGLRTLGIPAGAPFICFFARDSAYLETIESAVDWSYHNFRNSTIHNHVLAARELVERGYYAVRMGAAVQEPLRVSHASVIDYAVSGERSDFMDIYLAAHCDFFVTTGAGIDGVALIFRRPLVEVSYAPLEDIRTWDPNGLTIPKKYWLRAEGRFMAFREIYESGAGCFRRSDQFEAMGIELIENTAEEIAEVVVEMDERLKRTWQTTQEDEELQRRFWALFPKSNRYGEIKSRIGAAFLRQHRDWLEW